ncbi:MAG: ankyrin-related protein [Bryobacterales bacterium]|nr:ankyrin-related protein [Bryobacterales bacterium]
MIYFSLLLSASLLAGVQPDSQLAEAAKARNKAAIRTLLAKHVDVNAPQADGATALHWAVNQDDTETVEMLLRAGANAKAVNRYGVTPLSLACTNGNGEIVQALLKAGADPNTSLPGGETVLMTAARTGKVAAIAPLLARGAVVDAREKAHGQTALMWAAAEGNVEAVETLIHAGADIHARVGSGFTPFLFAVREGRIGTAQALLKAGADVNETVQTSQGTGPKIASGAGAPKVGTSALVLAVANAHFELAAKLLDAGADPNAAGPGYTALHMVTQVRKPGGGDNDPPPQGSGNMTSLELVKKLVEHRANLNARMTKRVNFGLTGLNTIGATPFFLAAKTADAELMRLLAKLGADPLILNADHSTPLMAAAGLGTRSPGEDAGTESEVVEAMQVALDLGADLNAVDDKGETAMHGAAYKNLPGAVQFLAEKGAKIEIWNQKNKHGWTPLTIAEGYRFGNFKPSPETVAALVKVMKAAGVPIPPERQRSPT